MVNTDQEKIKLEQAYEKIKENFTKFLVNFVASDIEEIKLQRELPRVYEK